MISRPITRALCAAAVAALTLAGCVVEHPLVNDLLSFEVQLAASAPGQVTGTEADRQAFVAGEQCLSDAGCPEGQVCAAGVCAVRYVFDVVAYGRDGEPYPYHGPVTVRVTPGVVADGVTRYMMVDGRLDGLEIALARSFGHTHVWIEADGYWPRPDGASYGQCSDGLDNDANGLIDMADPGCRDATDDMEAPVSLVSGVSPSLWFANPTIRDLQHADPIVISTSPLVGEQVQVTRGNLVVTNVVNNGFYVVDLEGNQADALFTSLFVFTYSKPKDLLYGDRLCGFSGAVQEHVGHTQVVFPTFEVYRDVWMSAETGQISVPERHAAAAEACLIDNDCPEDQQCCSTSTLRGQAPRDGFDGWCHPTGSCDEPLSSESGAASGAGEWVLNPACDGFPGLDPDAVVPEPWDVTELLLKEDRTDGAYQSNVWQNSQLLEAHESNLVTFRDVVVSTRFIACDRNGDGKVSGDDEKACRNSCTRDDGGVLCTDLEGYFEFAQYAGLVGTDKKKIYGSVALAASFKPLDIESIGGPDLSGRCTVHTTAEGFIEYLCEPITLEHLTGSLRHIYLCGNYGTEDQCDLQFWVIDPRFDDDVVTADDTVVPAP